MICLISRHALILVQYWAHILKKTILSIHNILCIYRNTRSRTKRICNDNSFAATWSSCCATAQAQHMQKNRGALIEFLDKVVIITQFIIYIYFLLYNENSYYMKIFCSTQSCCPQIICPTVHYNINKDQQRAPKSFSNKWYHASLLTSKSALITFLFHSLY